MRHVFALLPVLLGMPFASFCQTFAGSFRGNVTDPAGALVPGVRIAVRELDTGLERATASNEVGWYELPLLPPGRYRLEADKAGFHKYVRAGLTLDVNQRVDLTIELKIGDAAQTIQVLGETPLLEATTSSVGQLFDNQRVTELPFANRNFLELINLVAGMQDVGATEAPATQGSQVFGRWSSNGSQISTNEFMLDGATAILSNQNAASLIPSMDAISQVKIETNAMSAEYGRTGGSIINATFKSGTNQAHGSVYEFWKNRVLNANTWVNNRAGVRRDFTNINQFGYTVGGPVYIPKLYNGRNRTFFFQNFEGYRDVLPRTQLLTVPTATEQAGDFSGRKVLDGRLIVVSDPLARDAAGRRTAFPGNVVPVARIDPIARNLGSYYPEPNTTPSDPNTNVQNYLAQPVGRNIQNQWVVKADHNVTNAGRLFVRYSQSLQGGGAANLFANTPGCATCVMKGNPAGTYSPRGGGADLFVYPKNAVAGYTHTLSPNLLLDVRYSMNRQFLSRIPQSTGFDLVGAGFSPEFAKLVYWAMFPPITISGTNFVGLGTNANGDLLRRGDLTHAVQGSLTKVTARHTIKTGGDFRMFRFSDLQGTSVTSRFTFDRGATQSGGPAASGPNTDGWGYASFLLGLPSSGDQGLPGSALNQWFYAAGYIQDDWRVSRRLTVNAGFRYDVETPPTERFNRTSWFDTSVASSATARLPRAVGGLQFPAVSRKDRRRTDLDGNNFGPRLGLAFRLSNSVVLRAAYGIFYQPSMTNGYGTTVHGSEAWDGTTSFVPSSLAVASGDALIASTLRDPYPQGLNPPTGSTRGADTLIGDSMTTILRNAVIPYSQQYNFGIQWELRPWVVSVAWVGSHNVHQSIARELNQIHPQYFSLGQARLSTARSPNPFLGLTKVGTFTQPTLQVGQLLRPFPQFSSVRLINDTAGDMNFNSLQAKLERRLSRGLSLLANYTWSKNLGNVAIRNGPSLYSPAPQNNYDLRSERTLSPIDQPHRFNIAVTYALPVGKGAAAALGRAGGMLFAGWQLNGSGTLASGLALILQNATNRNGFGASQRLNNNGRSAKLLSSEQTPDRWFDTSVFSEPAAWTFGNTTRFSPDLRGSTTNNWRASVFKNERIGERFSLQIRLETFNVFNHPIWDNPGTQFTSPLFGRVTTKTGNRTGQLALKLLF